MDAKELLIREVIFGFVAVGKGNRRADVQYVRVPELEAIYNRVFDQRPGFLGSVWKSYDNPDQTAWMLSNGRRFTTSLMAYEIDLPFEYRGIVCLNQSSDGFSVDELIEMVCLVRTAPERINRHNEASLLLRNSLPKTTIKLNDWLNLLLSSTPQILIPVVYVAEFHPEYDTAQELIQQFGAEIVSLSDLWLGQANLLKPGYVTERLKNDVHPFEYGVTVFSPLCTVEFHPRSTNKIAQIEGLTLYQHHQQEWGFLTALLLWSGLQRVALESDSNQLDELISLKRSWNFIRALPQLRLLSTRRNNILQRVNLYWNVQFTRREYMNDILDKARDRFLLKNLYEGLNRKIGDLQEDINSAYNAYLSVAVFALTVAATSIALLQLLQAILTPPK
jgi:hypothetical protein